MIKTEVQNFFPVFKNSFNDFGHLNLAPLDLSEFD